MPYLCPDCGTVMASGISENILYCFTCRKYMSVGEVCYRIPVYDAVPEKKKEGIEMTREEIEMVLKESEAFNDTQVSGLLDALKHFPTPYTIGMIFALLYQDCQISWRDWDEIIKLAQERQT
jgi:hypothetical protein